MCTYATYAISTSLHFIIYALSHCLSAFIFPSLIDVINSLLNLIILNFILVILIWTTFILVIRIFLI